MVTRNSKHHPTARCTRSRGDMTNSRNIKGMAAMPAQGRFVSADGCGPGGGPSDGRLYREAMARNPSPQHADRHDDRRTGMAEPPEWDDTDWDPDQEEAAGHRARRLLSRPSSRLHRLGDGLGSFRNWIVAERWIRRVVVVVGALALIFVGCFGALRWRQGASQFNHHQA